MKSKHPHKNLDAWKEAMDLVTEVYRITSKFPKEEMYGLISQLRRASVSVPSNIAEGATGRTNVDFAHFLTVALGSLSEMDTQIEISYRLNYIDYKKFEILNEKIDQCKSIVFGLKKSVLRNNNEDGKR